MALPFAAILKAAAPYLINLLGSRIGAGAKYGDAKEMRRQLMELLSPEALGRESNELFEMLKGSPAYTGLRSQAMTGAASLANRLNSSFARRGLNTSGIAGVAEPLARSSFQQTFANIDADMFSKALAMARENLGTRAGILTGFRAPSIGAGTAGGFLSDAMPSLYKLIEKYWKTPTYGRPPVTNPSRWGEGELGY